MKKVVILGAGLATRLYPITHHIPKVLVNYKQHTILKHLYDTYKQYNPHQIIVVVHSKFARQVEAYAKLFDLDILVRTVDEAYGSAYAISRVSDMLNGHDVVFNWCDVIPTFDSFSWDNDSIYTFGNECRYKFDGTSIQEVGATGGNIVGIYQIKDFHFDTFESKDEANEYYRGRDFIDMLSPEEFYQDELKQLIDLGDKPKLLEAHKDKEICRAFNQIKFDETTVTKTALDAQGRSLQQSELNWYAHVDSNNIPTIVSTSKDSFTMTRIDGDLMSNVFKQEHIKPLLDALKFSSETVHINPEDKLVDFEYEVKVKVLQRCNDIRQLINSFGTITHVNGIKIGRLETMLSQALNHLKFENIDKPYEVCHGDPNFSNTLVDKDGNIKFIDPRGYFGKTKVYGPKIYDEAKILYAISGYDEFNSDPMWGSFKVENEHATVKVNSLLDIDSLSEFNIFHRLWVAVIWIALAGYFKNNPLKAVGAYYYGMYLLTNYLNKAGRRLLDGTVSHDLENGATVECVLETKNRGKWLLVDLETGQKYRPARNDWAHEWEKL